jgi:hypothetical protein
MTPTSQELQPPIFAGRFNPQRATAPVGAAVCCIAPWLTDISFDHVLPTRLMRKPLLAVGAALIVAGPLPCQTLEAVPAASLMRLTYRPLQNERPAQLPKPAVGRLLAVRADTILLGQARASDTARYAIRDLSNVEYSAGERHPRALATSIGLGVGTVIGAAYGYGRTAGAGYLCLSAGCSKVATTSKWRSAGQEGLIGAGAGLVAGFVTGSLVIAQRWVAVRIDVPVPEPEHRGGGSR